MMPKWIPGKMDGETVRVEFNLPVKFKLDADDGKRKKEVDELPQFLSGCENVRKKERKDCSQKQLINFIVENLKYPEATKKAAIEGMVVASFVVAEDGTVTSPKIVKSLDAHTDAEVLRILNEMPKWRPGMKGGKPVAAEMKLPFKFALPVEEGQPSWRGEAKNLAEKVELFQVYPNPATGNISVNFKTDSGPVTVRLADVEGKQLASMDLEHSGYEQLATFSTGDMPRGNMYVSLLGKGGEVLETTMVILQ
jgi:TonB family protein